MEMEGGMTVAPVPYDNFVQSPLGFLEDGGAWTFDNRSSSSRHMIFGAETEHNEEDGSCDEAYCLCMDGDACGNNVSCDSASFSIVTNISVDTSRYANADKLAFQWTYWSKFFYSPAQAVGEFANLNMLVGDQSMNEQVPIGISGRVWNGSAMTHSGSINLLKNGSTGYIPINLTFFMESTPSNAGIVMLFKDMNFKITTPASPAPQTSSSPASRKKLAVIIPSAIGGTLVLGLIFAGLFFLMKRRRNSEEQKNKQQRIADDSLDSGLNDKPPYVINRDASVRELPSSAPWASPLVYSNGTSDAPLNTARSSDAPWAMAGAGAAAAAAENSERQRSLYSQHSSQAYQVNQTNQNALSLANPPTNQNPTGFAAPMAASSVGSAGPTAPPSPSPPSSTGIFRSSTVFSSQTAPPSYVYQGSLNQGAPTTHTYANANTNANQAASSPQFVPFAQGLQGTHGTVSSPRTTMFDPRASMRSPTLTLSEFAGENRDLIPEELESKLMKVGYLPSDDPDVIPQEEWVKLYGVSRVELMRIKQLHTRWQASSEGGKGVDA